MDPISFYGVEKMSADIAKRLEILKSYRDDEMKQSNPSKRYLDDLEGSIAYFEKLLQKGYSIIGEELGSHVVLK